MKKTLRNRLWILKIQAENFLYTTFHHRRIIKDLEAELLKPLELRFEHIKMVPGSFEMIMKSPFFKDIILWLVETFKACDGADNYMTMSMADPRDNEIYDITIQRKSGKTRESLLQAEVEQLRKEIAELKAQQP
jgi:hypothetical protein